MFLRSIFINAEARKVEYRNGLVPIITPLDKCVFGVHPSKKTSITFPEGDGNRHKKMRFWNMRNCVPRDFRIHRHFPSQYSIVGTLRRFEDVFNQGTIIPPRAIQVLSDQSAVSSLDETRKDPSLPSPNLLIRTTIGITSDTLPAMVPECNDAANACERCNNVILRFD